MAWMPRPWTLRRSARRIVCSSLTRTSREADRKRGGARAERRQVLVAQSASGVKLLADGGEHGGFVRHLTLCGNRQTHGTRRRRRAAITARRGASLSRWPRVFGAPLSEPTPPTSRALCAWRRRKRRSRRRRRRSPTQRRPRGDALAEPLRLAAPTQRLWGCGSRPRGAGARDRRGKARKRQPPSPRLSSRRTRTSDGARRRSPSREISASSRRTRPSGSRANATRRRISWSLASTPVPPAAEYVGIHRPTRWRAA